MQQFLKPARRAARTEIVAAELFGEFLLTVNDSFATLHASFRRETFATFAGDFEVRMFGFVIVCVPYGLLVCCFDDCFDA